VDFAGDQARRSDSSADVNCYNHGMGFVLSALGAAFAGFCVWLAVRVYNRGERWAKWTAVAVVIVMLYPMSVGPVLWMDLHGVTPAWSHDIPLYQPVQWLRENGPEPIRDAINRYLDIWKK
jgi:hypothetical protein